MNRWEKRWHPLRAEWVIYAAHRNQRPWGGEVSQLVENRETYLKDCFLCPRNQRISGLINPDYHGVFSFLNDHPVVSMEAPDLQEASHLGLYQKSSAKGFAKVICYHPDHSKTMNDLSTDQLVEIMQAWVKVTEEAHRSQCPHILIFENQGKITGVSSLHPHCQVYATDYIFKFVEQELVLARKYRKKNRRNLFEDIIKAEQKDGTRIIAENRHALAFIPFFARYTFEVMVFTKQHYSTLTDLDLATQRGLMEVVQEVLRKYHQLYNMPFPYVMSIMQGPLLTASEYWLYLHFQPPLRQPGIRKYLAGPEIGGGNFMATSMPEESAAQLNKIA